MYNPVFNDKNINSFLRKRICKFTYRVSTVSYFGRSKYKVVLAIFIITTY